MIMADANKPSQFQEANALNDVAAFHSLFGAPGLIHLKFLQRSLMP